MKVVINDYIFYYLEILTFILSCKLFRAQISAYRNLARNQPISQQISMMAAGKRTGEAPPECPTPPAQPPYGDGQGTPPSAGAGPAGGKAGAGAAGDAARGGGGAPPTPLPMTGQMAPPTQPTPPLVNPVRNKCPVYILTS